MHRDGTPDPTCLCPGCIHARHTKVATFPDIHRQSPIGMAGVIGLPAEEITIGISYGGESHVQMRHGQTCEVIRYFEDPRGNVIRTITHTISIMTREGE